MWLLGLHAKLRPIMRIHMCTKPCSDTNIIMTIQGMRACIICLAAGNAAASSAASVDGNSAPQAADEQLSTDEFDYSLTVRY